MNFGLIKQVVDNSGKVLLTQKYFQRALESLHIMNYQPEEMNQFVNSALELHVKAGQANECIKFGNLQHNPIPA